MTPLCNIVSVSLQHRVRSSLLRRYLVVGTYVGVATVGVFVYWFTMYDTAVDGHSLITLDQLRFWNKCDAAALTNPSSIFFGFNIANSGGIDIGTNPCKYVLLCITVGYLSFGPIDKIFMFSVTLACARRTGAAARVERRRRER